MTSHKSNNGTLAPYSSLEQLEHDIIAFGLKFKIIHKQPTEKQLQNADTVYYFPLEYLPIHVKMQMGFGVIGLIMFGTKSMPFGYSGGLTKLGLKGFLFRSTTCGICSGPAFVGSNGCGQCGFLICAICEMKLGLGKLTDLSFPLTMIQCAKCRHPYKYSVLPSLNDVIFDMDKFNDEERAKLRFIIQDKQEMIQRRNGSEEHLKKMRKINEEFKDKMDISKCADCKKLFINKRSRCGGCRKVAYCDGVCQRKHWKQHKNDCKLFKTYVNECQ